MARRIEVELTSSRDDGTWTWRAAGARQPKGELDGALLYPGVQVGDVVRADAEFDLDGIRVTAVLPPKGARTEPERIEVIGSRRHEPGVTTTLAPKGSRGRRDRDRDGDRGDRGDRGGRGRGERSGRPSGDRAGRDGRDGRDGGSRGRGERRPRPERPAPPPKPKAPRLKAGRTHRTAALRELAPEQKALGELVLRGGIPAVRQEIDRQNELARADGRPEIRPAPLVALAEQLLGPLKGAEWRDRAEAALRQVDDLDLRDLRSVVVAADAAARDDESRELAVQLRDALARRVEEEHAAWLAEVAEAVTEGRLVRALRLSSRPPKAGTPFPRDLAASLAAAAAAGLTAETGSDRYAAVVEAVALSPVRQQVEPEGIPAQPSDALRSVIAANAGRVPQIAARFGIEATAAPRPRGRGGRGRPASGPRGGAPRQLGTGPRPAQLEAAPGHAGELPAPPAPPELEATAAAPELTGPPAPPALASPADAPAGDDAPPAAD
ncbi:MAG: hypothetical protein U0Q07_02590 [Acidimicrobiales bacterium]